MAVDIHEWNRRLVNDILRERVVHLSQAESSGLRCLSSGPHVCPYFVCCATPDCCARCGRNPQRRFLGEIGVSDDQARRVHILAPLKTRRDMTLLGVVHRCVLGRGPPHLHGLFELDWPHTRVTRHTRRHSRHRWDPYSDLRKEYNTDYVWGMNKVYNMLPAVVVSAKDVSTFLSKLQACVHCSVDVGLAGWHSTICSCVPSVGNILSRIHPHSP